VPTESTAVRAYLISLLFLLLYAGWCAETIHSPSLARYDEFLTLARTRSVVDSQDLFAIYTNNEPNMRKPPLQYWASAGLMIAGLSDEVSLRLPPFLFGVGTLILTALCAVHLGNGRDPWVAPAAVGFLGSSLLFAEHMRTGMLETGLCFFVMASVYSLWRAQSSSQWWIAWGVFCGLGALQKAPMALVASFAVGCGLYAGSLGALKEVVRLKPFRQGVSINLFLTAFWPILQTLRFGDSYRETVASEGLRRFTSGVVGEKDADQFGLYFDRLLFLTTDASVFWVLCAITIVAAAFWGRDFLGDRRVQGCLGFTAFVMLVILLAVGPVYSRYVLVFTPLMAAVTAAGLSRLSGRFWVSPVLALACLTYQAARMPLIHYKESGMTRPCLRSAVRIYSQYLKPGEPGLSLIPAGHKPVILAEVPFGKQSLGRRDEVLDREKYTAITYEPILGDLRKHFRLVAVKRRLGKLWIVEVSPRKKGQLLGPFYQDRWDKEYGE